MDGTFLFGAGESGDLRGPACSGHFAFAGALGIIKTPCPE